MAVQSNTNDMAGSPSPESTPKTPLGIKLEKNAGLIMGTNNSSIVSKRSVERLYYPKPHFFQYFVRKPQRRSPTINRGYWLRMQAVDNFVKEFLHRPSTKQKLVINLGCG
jgi:tRNA wybutosine-synthesizing protein 4